MVQLPTPDYTEDLETLTGQSFDLVEGIRIHFGESVEESRIDETALMIHSPIAVLFYSSWTTGKRMRICLNLELTAPWSFDYDIDLLIKRLVSQTEQALNTRFYSLAGGVHIYRQINRFDNGFNSYSQYRRRLREIEENELEPGVQITPMCHVSLLRSYRDTGYDNFVVGCPVRTESYLYLLWLARHDAAYPQLEEAGRALGPEMRVVRDDALEFGSHCLGSYHPTELSLKDYNRGYPAYDPAVIAASEYYLPTENEALVARVTVPRDFNEAQTLEFLNHPECQALGLKRVTDLADTYGLYGFGGAIDPELTEAVKLPRLTLANTGEDAIQILRPDEFFSSLFRQLPSSEKTVDEPPPVIVKTQEALRAKAHPLHISQLDPASISKRTPKKKTLLDWIFGRK